MVEKLPNIPPNIDNCINYCPRMQGLFSEGGAEIAAICIKEQCPGPIVQERIVDISDVSDDESSATTEVRVCGCDLSARSYSGSRPEDYVEGMGGPGEADIADDETVLVRELTQEEIRRELRHKTAFGE